ncbi:MAG: hypothetical protein AB7O98_17805 [Hyphomonadaceae bacterium]
MPTVVVIAGLASILATAVLTWILWRVNQPPTRGANDDGAESFLVGGNGGKRTDDVSNDSNGGGDGGGGE